MSYFTLKNGEKIFYEDTQNGDNVIVMLHGWTSTHEVFSPIVSAIKDRARCIIYDHRGHGNSKGANQEKATMDTLACDLNELVDSLGISSFTLLGWSMGAGVAMKYTELFGCSRIKQVILCDMTPKQINDDEWKLGLYQGKYTRQDMEKDQGKKFFDLYKEFAIAAIPKLAKVPGFLLKKPLKKKLDECDEGVLRSLSKSMKEMDLRYAVGKINVPVHYFYAVPGSLFSPKLADWYRDHVTSEFNEVPFENSTHMLVSDNPEKFAKEVMKVIG